VAKSELVESIRDAYFATHTDVSAAPVDHFCQFVVGWLSEHGVVGVGHTSSGLALRMTDGTEKLLISLDVGNVGVDTPAVGIGTGGKASAREGIGCSDTSVSITNA
jgi:hypothetical protein